MGKTSPYVVSFLVRFIYGVMQILTKVAFNQGTSTYVLVFYRHVIATMLLLPIAFATERVSASLNISFVGLNYASATSATAVQNLQPVLTFFLALLLGGLVKPNCDDWTQLLSNFRQRVEGPLLEEYPSMLLNMTLQIVFATVQSFFMALVMERDFSRWKPSLDVGLVAIVYSGVVVSAFSNYLLIWVIDKCGPVFLAMTVPLTFVITIVLSLLIGEAVTLGSVISGALMVGGLYNVLWGKRIEQVTLSKQGGIETNAASFDLEEQESGAPVPLTRDSIKQCERED
ncbi:unnamed protein product [Triticum turgidum subsp. durum]|uniref:WAT1-related protein n=1 Tax=Triticum turgidum subsp. durum TaxID=4567 RepID=A0A9R0WUD7_TRITD|nr:unnamed protein product [Triticum turgidum subsp. durum]